MPESTTAAYLNGAVIEIATGEIEIAAANPACLVRDKGVPILANLRVVNTLTSGGDTIDQIAYIGYRIIELLQGALGTTGGAIITTDSKISTFINSISIGLFEPLLVKTDGGYGNILSIDALDPGKSIIDSLLGPGNNTCVALKAQYTKSSALTTTYIDIPITGYTIEKRPASYHNNIQTPSGGVVVNSPAVSALNGVASGNIIKLNIVVPDTSLSAIYAEMDNSTDITLTLGIYVGNNIASIGTTSAFYPVCAYTTNDAISVTATKSENTNTMVISNKSTVNTDTYTPADPWGFVGLFNTGDVTDSSIVINVTET